MRVLVTGSSGFLGRNTCIMLENSGHEAIRADRNETGTAVLDLADSCEIQTALNGFNPDAVINCAAIVDWSEHALQRLFPVNTMAPGFIASWCAIHSKHFVQASGTLIYGAANEHINTDSPEHPDTDYGRSKHLADKLILASGARASVVRLCGLYGRGGPAHLGLNNAITLAFGGGIPSIKGKGSAKRNYLYVKDAARFLVFCIEQKLHGTFIAASKEILSISEILHTLCDVAVPGKEPIYVEGDEARDQVVEPSQEMIATLTFREAFEDML